MRADQRYAQRAGGIVESILGLTDGLKLKRIVGTNGGALTPSAFTGALVIPTGPLAEMLSGDSIYDGDVSELWPVQMRWLTAGHDGARPVHLSALESVTAAEARGRVMSAAYSRMLRLRWAAVGWNGKGWTTESFFGVRQDGSLAMISNGGSGELRRIDDQIRGHLEFAIALQMTLEYDWTVEVKKTGSNFAISLLTTPHGARKFLSLRDVPPGRERRAALRHWVTEHRRSVGPEGRQVDVREHLRGAIPFRWEDLEGVVKPSPYDLRRAGAPNQPGTAS